MGDLALGCVFGSTRAVKKIALADAAGGRVEYSPGVFFQ